MTLPTDPQLLAEACARWMYERDHNARHTGIELVSVQPGRAVMRLQVLEHMANSHGICHGGVLFALCDTAFAYACNSYNCTTLAAACHITYLRPAHLGETLTATAEERSRSGRSGVYDVTLTGRDGAVLALFRGQSQQIRSHLLPEGANPS